MCKIGNQTFISIAAALLLAAGCSAEQQSQTEPEAQTAAAEPREAPTPAGHSGVIEGVVRDANGEPVAGAYVKLRNDERRLTFMHISQEGGRYTAIKLPEGSYTVQAVGGSFESAWSAPVEIAESGSGAMDVSLDVERAPYLEPAWTRRAPEYNATFEHLPDGPAKDIMMRRCVACHSETRIISRHVDYDTWQDIISEMRLRAGVVGYPEITDDEAETMTRYLADNYPPLGVPDPNSRFPFELQPENARNYRVVEYDMENPLTENHDIAVDPWGDGWSNQRLGGKLGRLDPVTYDYSEVELPPSVSGRVRPGNPQISRDGMLWLGEGFGNRWLRYDIANDEWTEFPFPSDEIRGAATANTMALASDGTVWASGPGAARRFDPASGEWEAWDTPSWEATGLNPGGYGITEDGNGRMWMAENQIDRVARVDPDTGEVMEFRIPSDETHYPRRMDHDPQGNVWIALWSSGRILHVDYRTDELSFIDPPIPNNGIYAMDFDESTGLMWTTLHTRDIIASYNPATGEWKLYPQPQAESDSRRVEIDQNSPNRIWWTSVAYQSRMGFTELLDE
jgi:streptogramin lyase